MKLKVLKNQSRCIDTQKFPMRDIGSYQIPHGPYKIHAHFEYNGKCKKKFSTDRFDGSI